VGRAGLQQHFNSCRCCVLCIVSAFVLGLCQLLDRSNKSAWVCAAIGVFFQAVGHTRRYLQHYRITAVAVAASYAGVGRLLSPATFGYALLQRQIPQQCY
jgi:hypothetical protein